MSITDNKIPKISRLSQPVREEVKGNALKDGGDKSVENKTPAVYIKKDVGNWQEVTSFGVKV